MRPSEYARNSAVEIPDGNFMPIRTGVHTANQTHVIDDAGGVRQQL